MAQPTPDGNNAWLYKAYCSLMQLFVMADAIQKKYKLQFTVISVLGGIQAVVLTERTHPISVRVFLMFISSRMKDVICFQIYKDCPRNSSQAPVAIIPLWQANTFFIA